MKVLKSKNAVVIVEPAGTDPKTGKQLYRMQSTLPPNVLSNILLQNGINAAKQAAVNEFIVKNSSRVIDPNTGQKAIINA